MISGLIDHVCRVGLSKGGGGALYGRGGGGRQNLALLISDGGIGEVKRGIAQEHGEGVLMKPGEDVPLHRFGEDDGMAAGGGEGIEKIILKGAVEFVMKGLLHIVADIRSDFTAVVALPLVVAIEYVGHEEGDQSVFVQIVNDLVQVRPECLEVRNVCGTGGDGSRTVQIADILGKGLLQVVQQLEQGTKIAVVEPIQGGHEHAERVKGIFQCVQVIQYFVERSHTLPVELVVSTPHKKRVADEVFTALHNIVQRAVFRVEVEFLRLQLLLRLLDGAA